MTAKPRHRICWVGSHGGQRDAYPSVARLLAPLFETDGHEVLLVSTRSSKLAKAWDIFRTMKASRRHYDVTVVDVFSTSAFRYAQLAAFLARRLKKGLVLLLHGGGLPALAKSKPERVSRLLASADLVVAPSAYLAREVGGRLSHPVEVIENPVDLAQFRGRHREVCRPTLLWVRSFRDMYRPNLAIRALAALRERGLDARLTMVGPDHDGALAATASLAEEIGVSAYLSTPGLCSRETVARLMQEADIFLNTTSVDNAPVSVIEALASGLCVVSTAVGGLSDLLADEGDALLVPEGSGAQMAGAFADTVERLIEEPALASTLSRAALLRSPDFDERAVVQKWYRAFSGLPKSPAASVARETLACV